MAQNEKFEVVIDYGDPACGIVALKLPFNNKKHLRDLHSNEHIELPDNELDVTDDEELIIATMSFLMESIYMEVLKTLHVASEINLRKLAILMKRPYSDVYNAARALHIMNFIEVEGGAGRQGTSVKLLIKVIPGSEQTKWEIAHPKEFIIECKQRLPKEEIVEKKYVAEIRRRLGILEGHSSLCKNITKTAEGFSNGKKAKSK